MTLQVANSFRVVATVLRSKNLNVAILTRRLIVVLPPGKSGRKISREIWGFEIFRFPGNLCRDPGKFFYVSKGFSGTDIYHSDIKNALLQL